MIDKDKLKATVEEAIRNTDAFIVDITVSGDNVIDVEIDSASSVDIDTCAGISRAIEAEFDRDVEDYELMVGSAGLTSPFKVKGQYDKNVGNQIEVLTRDGRKLRGELTEVGPDKPDGTFDFVLTTQQKVRLEGKKRPELVDTPVTLNTANVKTAVYLIDFK